MRGLLQITNYRLHFKAGEVRFIRIHVIYNTCAVYKCIQSVGVLFKCVAVPLLIRIELLLPKFLMKG